MPTVTVILCALVVAGAVAFPFTNWSLIAAASAVVVILFVVLLYEMY